MIIFWTPGKNFVYILFRLLSRFMPGLILSTQISSFGNRCEFSRLNIILIPCLASLEKKRYTKS